MASKRTNTDDTLSNCKKMKACNALESDDLIMNYSYVPSLESMSIVSIVTALCKQSDISDDIQKHSIRFNPPKVSFRGSLYDRSVLKIEKKILDKVASLPLPNVLKVKMFDIVVPIQLQIIRWIRHGRKDKEYMDSIFWSNKGTIDETQTLKQLIKTDSIDLYVNRNLKLACQLCSEESIHDLWKKLPRKSIMYLHGDMIYKNYDTHLLAYWRHYILNDLVGLLGNIKVYDPEDIYNLNQTINMNMFKLALLLSNISAVKYFWNKLTSLEVSKNLMDWIRLTVRRRRMSGGSYQGVQRNGDILIFLLSKMNSNSERFEVLQSHTDVILITLCNDWPWQRLFLPTIKLLWGQLGGMSFVRLVNNITSQIREENTADYLFLEFWDDSPLHLKKHFIEYVLSSYCNTDVFCNLLIAGKVGVAKAILRYANSEDQYNIMFSLVKTTNFVNIVHSNKLDLFDKLCVEMLSQSDIKCLKERILCDNGNIICQKWIKRGSFDKLDAFLNWASNTQERIEQFKKETLRTVKITHSLLYYLESFDLADRFLSWSFGSEEEIHKFKLSFVKSKPKIIEIGVESWLLFEKFVDWCFSTDEEIQDFKSFLTQSSQFMKILFSSIKNDCCFDFVEQIINWCFNSNEEKKEFKGKFALSSQYLEILQLFVSNNSTCVNGMSNYELIKKLFNLVSPLDRTVTIELKRRISSDINFEEYRISHRARFCCKVKKRHLFSLLDGHNMEDCIFEEVSALCLFHNERNEDAEITAALNDILETVENSLQVDNY